MKLAGQSSAAIYTIGLFDEQDPDRNPGVLKRLAQATGGQTFLPGNCAKWSPSARVLQKESVISTPSDMFPSTGRATARIAPFG